MKRSGLVAALCLGVGMASCGGSNDDGEGGGSGASGSSGARAGGGGAQAGSSGRGAGGQGGASAGAPACQQLCDRGVELCNVDRATCTSDCNALFAGGACAAEANALLACQERETGTCEDGELVLVGCDTEAIAAAACALEAGEPSGGGAGGTDPPLTTSELVEMIGQRCQTLCGADCPSDEDCVDHCRVTGARRDECAREYLDFLGCYSGICGGTSIMIPDSCAAQEEALRACLNPSVPSGSLTCTQACDRRLEAGCVEDVRRDICADTCAGAEAKPECATAVAAYATCMASSRDICVPDGQLATECVDEARALGDCADLGADLLLCTQCINAVFETGAACNDELEACGDAFTTCLTETMCLTNCVTFSISDPTGPQTLEACAESCGAGIGSPDPLGFRPVVDCIACNCTEACARLQAMCR